MKYAKTNFVDDTPCYGGFGDRLEYDRAANRQNRNGHFKYILGGIALAAAIAVALIVIL